MTRDADESQTDKTDSADSADGTGEPDELHVSADAEVVDSPDAAPPTADAPAPDAAGPKDAAHSLTKTDIPADARQWAMFCHLAGLASYMIPFGGIVAPLVLWQVKKDEHPFIDEQGKAALNFNITVAIALLVAGLLVFAFIGILLLPVVAIGAVALSIMAALKANDGEHYRYPISLHLVK